MNRRKNDKTFVFGLGRIIVAIIALLFLMRTFVADLAIVRGRSMLPGLKASDIVFVFKAAYGLRNPRGGYLLLWSEPEERQLVAAVRPESTAVFSIGQPPILTVSSKKVSHFPRISRKILLQVPQSHFYICM